MDISAKSWQLEKSYQKNDIVKVDNLSVPNEIDKYSVARPDNNNLISDKNFDCSPGNIKISDEEGALISIDPSRGRFFKKTVVSSSIEIPFGFIFSIDKSIPYTFKTYVRKTTALSDTQDPYLTDIQISNGVIDKLYSNGVGVGVKFFDAKEEFIEVENYRPLVRPMASSELSESEYYNVQLDVAPSSIPENAVKAQAFIFVYGHKEGGFEFRDVRSSSANKFFYCVEDHTSSPSNYPSSSKNWTQNFVWRPSYGSRSSYKASNESMQLGESYDYVNNLAINSLPLELNLSFNNRTDKEAKAILHFLQEKHFPYESIYALDYKGERLLSTDVQAFNFVYSFPYRTDLKFTCVEFDHSISYRNNNSVSAKFICNTESTLRSVESHSGYNDRIDAVLPIKVNKDIDLEKGKTIRLDTFSMDEDSKESLSSLIEIYVYRTDENNKPTSGVLFFREAQDLKKGDCLYIEVDDPEDSIFSIGFARVFRAINNKTFIFGNGEGFVIEYFEQSIITDLGKNIQLDSCEELITEPIPKLVLKSRLLNSGDPSDVGHYLILSDSNRAGIQDIEDRFLKVLNKWKDAPATVSKLRFCPEDCLTANTLFPEGCELISKDFTDKITGEKRKRIIHLSNYVQLQLESDIDSESFSFEVTPLSNFTLKSGEAYNVIVPAICGRSSIYLEDPEKIAKFPYYKVRNFEHRPTLSFNLSQKPKHTESKFLEYYNKRYKKSINQNMSTFNVVFDMRDDNEASEILQFLESHLGYKKFRFAMPRPYGADASSLTTPGRPNNSVFYCPDWQHDIVYKNNHLISATFIESTTNIQEDVSNIEEPCFGVTLFDNVNRHSLCTFSSTAIASHQSGLIENGPGEFSLNLEKETLEIVFILDSNGSILAQYLDVEGESYSKFQLIKDSILKAITGYDKSNFPGTISYQGKYNAEPISENEPPWYGELDQDGNLQSILSKNYNLNAEREKESSEILRENGYDLSNLERFIIDIDDYSINVGVVIIGDSSGLNKAIIGGKVSELPNHPKCFDKIELYKSLNDKTADSEMGKNALDTVSEAMAQFYNSPKAGIINKRMVFFISDFVFGNESESIINLIKACKKDGELAKRRPLDSVLKNYGNPEKTINIKIGDYSSSQVDPSNGNVRLRNDQGWIEMPETVSIHNSSSQYVVGDIVLGDSMGDLDQEYYQCIKNTVEAGAGSTIGVANNEYWQNVTAYMSNLYNPDFTGDFSRQNYEDFVPGSVNSSWYTENIQTTFIPVGLGKKNNVAANFRNYSSDFNNSEHELYYDISNESPGSLEADRIVNFVTAVKNLTTNDYGKIFSVNIKNCGPNPIKILNTIVKFESSESIWETTRITSGIPASNQIENITYIEQNTSNQSPKVFSGGQYYFDENNQKFLSKKRSDILWKNFNTKYEVFRKGDPYEINGGWKPDKKSFEIATDLLSSIVTEDGSKMITDPIVVSEIKTKGVNNDGIAFKNFPARVFNHKDGLKVLDFNIGSVNQENEGIGNYEHLPIIDDQESIDLFFGVNYKGEVKDFEEKIQMIFNTEDIKDKKMDCYPEFRFNVNFNKDKYKIESPKTELNRCKNRVLALAMCNSNAIIDDNFAVYLNGRGEEHKIGEWNFNRNDYIGNVLFAADTPDADNAKRVFALLETGLVCPPSKMTVGYFNPNLIRWGEPANEIFLKNIQNNRHGNFGQLKFISYKVGTDLDQISGTTIPLSDGTEVDLTSEAGRARVKTLAEPIEITTTEYGGWSGSDFGPFTVRIDSCE